MDPATARLARVLIPVLLMAWLCLLGNTSTVLAQPRPHEPAVHPEFPIRERTDLSPPIVDDPIHECAAAVHVRGAVPHATVEVIANGAEVVGKDSLWMGEGDVQLSRILSLGESITAQQTVNGVTSLQSIQAVPVTAFAPGGLGKPDVAKDIWSCGIVVPTGNLVPSTTVRIFENGALIGQGNSTGNWLPVLTQPLVGGRGVRAQQVICEADPSRRIEGPLSEPPVPVGTAPNPPPAPTVSPSSVVPGKDSVDVLGLFTGAEVVVRDAGNVISSGSYATGSANWVPVSPAPGPSPKVDAAQRLCAPSPFSPVVDTPARMRDPELVGPICDGQQFAVIRNTMLGANVVVKANGVIVGYGGGNGGELILGLSRKLRANPADQVVVLQYYVQQQPSQLILSGPSNTVTVTSGVAAPSVWIDGGEPFFLAELDEQQIDGPVFPRGRGAGPVFKIQTCCGRAVRAQVLGPNDEPVADLALKQVFLGYFTATWDWKSSSGWAVPQGIPIGAYTIRVTTDCNQEPARARFYVVFDPAEVSGPPRFSFDESAVWFYSPSNKTMPMPYALHPDDARIFSRAIQAASGDTSALNAAIRIAAAESAIFSYSVTKSDTDTLALLNQALAQCADDAAMLTAMLRSVGIPSHPVTADAGAETGSIGWSFDTWTEFQVPGPSGPQWQVVHTHWPDNSPTPVQGPMDRGPFGHSVGVATKQSNDIVVMAGENWLWNEVGGSTPAVTFNRQQCGEPNQSLNAKPWIVELCEAGYWNASTHWSCPGASARSLRLLRIVAANADHRSRIVAGSVVVENTTEARLDGSFSLELVADIPETKIFGDRVVARRDVNLALARGARRTLRFEFPMGDALAPNEELHVRLVRRGETLATVDLGAKSAVAIEAERQKDLRLGTQDALVVTVRNRADAPARGLEVRLAGPPQVRVSSEPSEVRSALAPREAATFRFAVTGVAELDAGVLTVSVITRDAGVARLTIPVRVQASVPQLNPRRPSLERR